MTLYDFLNNDNGRGFWDYTFLYNPSFDYEPLKGEDLVKKSWEMVGKNVQEAMMSYKATGGA